MAPVHYKNIYNNETFNRRLCRTLRQCHIFADGRKKSCGSSSDKNNCLTTAQFEKIDVTDVKNKFDFLRSIGLEAHKNGQNDDAGLNSTKTTGDLAFVDVKCELCGRSFERKADVRLHLKMHHFKMALADYICNERRAVKDCKVVIVGESCKICGKDFKCKTDVELHRKKRHFAEKRKRTRLVLKIGGEVISIVFVKRKHLKRRYEDRNVNKRGENVGANVEGDGNVYYLPEMKRLCDESLRKNGGGAQMAPVSSHLEKVRDKMKKERSEIGLEEKRLQEKLKEGTEENKNIVDASSFVKREAEEVRVKIEIERQSEEEVITDYDRCVLDVDNVVVEQIPAKSENSVRRNNGDYELPFICQNSIIKEEVFLHENVQKDHFSMNLEPNVECLKMHVGSRKVLEEEEEEKEEADILEVIPVTLKIQQNSEFSFQKIGLPLFSSEKSFFASENSQVHNDEEIQEVHFNDSKMKINRDSSRLQEREVSIENNVQETITIDDDCTDIIELQKKNNFKRNFEDVLERTDRSLCDRNLPLKKSNCIFNVEVDDRFIGQSNNDENRLLRKRKHMSSTECIQEITIMSDEEMNSFSDEENCYMFNVNEEDKNNNNHNNNNNNGDDDDDDNNNNNDKMKYPYDNEIQMKERKEEYECKKAEVNQDNSRITQNYIDTYSAPVWIKEEVILDDYIFCTNDLNF